MRVGDVIGTATHNHTASLATHPESFEVSTYQLWGHGIPMYRRCGAVAHYGLHVFWRSYWHCGKQEENTVKHLKKHKKLRILSRILTFVLKIFFSEKFWEKKIALILFCRNWYMKGVFEPVVFPGKMWLFFKCGYCGKSRFLFFSLKVVKNPSNSQSSPENPWAIAGSGPAP